MGITSADLCPVSAMLNYLVVIGDMEGPLFKFRDGRFLTRQRLVERDQSKYCSHSFRIGAGSSTGDGGLGHQDIGESGLLGIHQNP